MAADPAADGGGVEPAAIVEAAILILPRGRVIFGLGMTQQQQTAHGWLISIRSKSGLASLN